VLSRPLRWGTPGVWVMASVLDSGRIDGLVILGALYYCE